MLDCKKDEFSLEEGAHYLNCAYKAPMLKVSEEAAMKVLLKQRHPYKITPESFFTETRATKKAFAQLVNAKANEIAAIPSVSYGMASVLNNIGQERGSHAIIVKNEFPSIHFAVQRWCAETGTDLKVVSPQKKLVQKGQDWNERLLESIQNDTAFVLLSSIHWMDGTRFDLKKIGKRCQETNTLFILDGSQSVGIMPMDVKKFRIDALVCAAYKWLLGPYSIGMAFIGEAFHNGKPLEEAWMNRKGSSDFTSLTAYESSYKSGAARFSMGEASNFINMAYLKAALEKINEWQPEEMQTYCRKLKKPLLKYFREVGIDYESPSFASEHLIGLNLGGHCHKKDLQQNLIDDKVFVSNRGKNMRVSLNVYNTKEDVAALINAIENSRSLFTLN